MATYNFNGNPILAPFSIRSNEPVFYSETVSLKTQITSPGSQRWELSFKTLQQDNIVDEMVDSITTKVTGGTMVMPQVNAAGDRLAHQGTIEAQGAHAAGLQVIAVTGTNNSDTIPKGYFIKFAGHNKVYMVTSDADIDSGTGTVNIFPALTTAVADNEDVLTGDSSVLSYIRNPNDIRGITFQDGILTDSGVINLIEKV